MILNEIDTVYYLCTDQYLLRENPSLRVAVVEKEIVGFGASGRNGGCSSKFPVTPRMLEQRFGRDAAVPSCGQ